ncbi:MAG: sugar phosphate isomerase/epimerase [Bryobacterales bacterium]|nr:sugar phosphate isomerase/epimerase [Bryobacterales bacterium]
MKLSCIPVSFFDAIRGGQMSTARWMDFAAGLGLDGVECGPPLIRPLGPVSPAEYRKLAWERGLPVSNYTAYSDFAHPDAAVRQREIAAALRNVAIARELGAPSVRALAGQRWPGVEEAQGVAWVVEGIRRMAEEADRAGIRVNLENHTKASTWENFDFAIRGSVFLRVLEGLRDVPVGVQFDTANPLVAGEDALELFEKVKARIGYLHVNDMRRPGVFEFVVAGSGIAPIREVLERMHRQGYAGWVGIEEASRTGEDGFRSAVKYIRAVLAELGKPPAAAFRR